MELNPLTALSLQILEGRGITDEKEILRLVQPLPTDLPTPAYLPSLEKGIINWIGQTPTEKPVLVYGDYDVDGIVSTAIVTKALRYLGFTVTSFVPHRIKHGYGLKFDTLVEQQIGQYGSLVVLDSGTSATDCHEWLEKSGIPYLILDHHEPSIPKPITQSGSIINTHWEGVGQDGVCTSLMAYLFVKCLFEQVEIEEEGLLTDLMAAASIGIVADSCPLTGFNHTTVKLGLEALSKCKWPGIKALLNKASIGWPTATNIAWKVAPRLNAAGRVDDARFALDLLLSERQEHAEGVASVLEEMNTQRREIQNTILASVAEEAAKQAPKGGIVVGGSWHPGVLGIIAGRLAETHKVPVCVLSQNGNLWSGSARAPEGIDLLGIFDELKDFMGHYGGHKAAAGLTVTELELFTEAFQLVASGLQSTRAPIKPEAIIDSRSINRNEAYALACLGPFGMSNPEPLLEVEVVKYLETQASDKYGNFRIYFPNRENAATGRFIGHIRNTGGPTFFDVTGAAP